MTSKGHPARDASCSLLLAPWFPPRAAPRPAARFLILRPDRRGGGQAGGGGDGQGDGAAGRRGGAARRGGAREGAPRPRAAVRGVRLSDPLLPRPRPAQRAGLLPALPSNEERRLGAGVPAAPRAL